MIRTKIICQFTWNMTGITNRIYRTQLAPHRVGTTANLNRTNAEGTMMNKQKQITIGNYFFVFVFTVPLFFDVPIWYGTIETVIVSFFLFMGVMAIIMFILYLEKNKYIKIQPAFTTEEQEKLKNAYASYERVTGWLVICILTISMYIQDIYLFLPYFIMAVVVNVLGYFVVLKKRLDMGDLS